MKYNFSPWVNPDQLRLTPKGELKMRDGSDPKKYLRAWMKAMNKTRSTPITFMSKSHADMVNFPWAS